MAAGIGAAIVGVATWAIGNVASKKKEQAQNKANAELARKTAERLRTEQKDAKALFDKSITKTHGADFLSALKAGTLSSENLIAKLGSNTSYAKALENYTRLGRQDMSNAKQDTEITGIEAESASKLSLSEMQAMDMAQAQATGAAQASGATSGIRTSSGTGANAETIQVLSNKLEKDAAMQYLENQRSNAINKMTGITRSGSQSAENYRKQKEIDSNKILEEAFVNYAKHEDEIADMEQDAKQYDISAKAYDGASEVNGWEWAVSWMGF